MAEFVERACKLCHACARLKMKMGSRSTLLRRMNSLPSPTTSLLSVKESSEKENLITFLRKPTNSQSSLEEQDSCSQDSGWAEDASSEIRFATPTGLAPRRSVDPSPGKSWRVDDGMMVSPLGTKRSFSSVSPCSVRSLSFSSDSFDDGFSDLFDLEKMDENAPIAIKSLLTGQLLSNKKTESPSTPVARPTIRRAFSVVENSLDISPSNQICEGLLAFKRPRELSSLKRRKSGTAGSLMDAPRHKLQRSVSETAATFLPSTLSSLYERPELIADFSCAYALPVVSGSHNDLTTISADTMAALIRGEFSSSVRSYTVIDCRYPYEFEGGHIRGAVNLYTCDQIESSLLRTTEPPATQVTGDPTGRNILIFHCEFSLARGPSMYRWLRRVDRNESDYPALQYPEVYLLHGGYKSFHTAHDSLCEPTGYRPMLDPNFETDLRSFRGKATSWSANRASFKRLGLL